MRAAALLLAGLLLGCGGGDLTPCDTALGCVILCTCANGATASGSGYACTGGYCRDGHAADSDCVDICGRVGSGPGVIADDDDSGSAR